MTRTFEINKSPYIKVNWHIVCGTGNSGHYTHYNMKKESDVKRLSETINPEAAIKHFSEKLNIELAKIEALKTNPIYNMISVKSLAKDRESLLFKINEVQKKVFFFQNLIKTLELMTTMTPYEQCIAIYEHKLGSGIR